MAKMYTFTRHLLSRGLLLLFLSIPYHGLTQLTDGCVDAGFGVDGDVYANVGFFGGATGNRAADWFESSLWFGGIKGIIDTSRAPVLRLNLQVGRNIAFAKGPAFVPNSVVDGFYVEDAIYVRDYYGSFGESDQTTFTAAASNGANPADWSTGVNGLSPERDIVDLYGHLRRDGSTAGDSLWYFLGASTVGTAGVRYLDFELYQENVFYEAGTGFSDGGPDEGHTAWTFNGDGSINRPGDLTVVVDYSPSLTPQVALRIWVSRSDFNTVTPQNFSFGAAFDGSTPTSTYGYAEIALPASGLGCGTANYVSGPVANSQSPAPPWGTVNSSGAFSDYYDQYQLIEVGINLTALGLDVGTDLVWNPCDVPFSKVVGKSRSAAAFTAPLIDFTGPYPFYNTVPIVGSIVGDTLRCDNDPATLTVDSIMAYVDYFWTTPDGNIVGNSNQPSIQVDAPGTYFVDISSLYCGPAIRDSFVVIGGTEDVFVYVNSETCDPAQAGVYLDTIPTQFGCDSIVAELVSLVNGITTNVSGLTCDPGQVGTNTTVYPGTNGCDSTVIETLSLAPQDTTYLNATTCDPTMTGVFFDTLQNQYGCDSTLVTLVSLINGSSSTTASTTCDPGQVGIFTTVYPAANGCDSIVTDTVSLAPSQTIYLTSNTCAVDSAGTNAQTYINQYGCDSTVIETVIYLPPVDTTIQTSVCTGGSYSVADTVLTDPGTYDFVLTSSYGCDSLIRLELFLNTEICDNGIDDDCDGIVDEVDLDCPSYDINISCDGYYYYVPPVWQSPESRVNQPSHFEISTSYPNAKVNVQTGDGVTFNRDYSIDAGNPLSIPLTIDLMQTPNDTAVEFSRGFVISSDVPVQILYVIDGVWNKVLMTVKGEEAMGRAFRTGSQLYTNPNKVSPGENHFISVIATQENTEVTFTFDADLVNVTSPHTVTLDKGETFLLRDNDKNETITGSLVTSDKPIVVVSGSQHSSQPGTVDRDGGIDMLVPVQRIGDQYVLIRGQVPTAYDYGIIVGVENGTEIFLNGSTTPLATINAGEYYQYNLSGSLGTPHYIETSRPTYVYHVSGLFSQEVGMGLVSPIGACRGSRRVDFSNLFTGDIIVYVVIEDAGLSSLTINGDLYNSGTVGATAIPVPGLPGYSSVLFQSSTLGANNIVLSDSYFSAGLMVGSPLSGTFGYLNSFDEKINILHPETGLPTAAYLVDTICGGGMLTHCLDIESCGINNQIVSIDAGPNTKRITATADLCFEYEPVDGFTGVDNVQILVENELGIRGVVCLQFYVCQEEEPPTEPCLAPIVQWSESEYVPVVQCQYLNSGVATYAPPMFADVDGDGETELVVLLQDNPNGFVVLNPTTCGVEHTINVGGNIVFKEGGLALGDVDRDGVVDIFVPVGRQLQRWEYQAAGNQIIKVWETTTDCVYAERRHLDILDLNNDGDAELIPNGGRMVDALTGYVYPGDLPTLHTQGKGLYAFTADADPGNAPAGQGNVELLYGSYIYRYDFNNERWVLVRKQPNSNWGPTANVSIADMDLDGDVDGVIANYGTGEAIIWDLQTNALLGGGLFDYTSDFGGRITIANLDTDPYPEMAMVSKRSIFAIEDIVTAGRFGNIIWLDNTTDNSGHTQITSFDFEGDGRYEICYRDQTQLRVFRGLGNGFPTGGFPSGPDILLATGNSPATCASETGMEYPTIGDVDGDGAAEMVVTCNGFITVYESGLYPWRDAVKVWNSNAFNVTNVNEDGTIPTTQAENYLTLNNFLTQVSPNASFYPDSVLAADVIVTISDIEVDCYGTLTVGVEVCNQGDYVFPGNAPLAFYDGNPEIAATLLDTIHLREPIWPGSCINEITTKLTLPSDSLLLYALVNDPGAQLPPLVYSDTASNGSFPFINIAECDYTNNIADSLFINTPDPVTTNFDETVCPGSSFTFQGITYTDEGTYVDSLTASNGCDSLVVFTLNYNSDYDTIQLDQSICNGSSYFFFGQSLTETGIYTQVLPNPGTCDRMLILDFVVFDLDTIRINTMTCDPSQMGSSTSVFQNQAGCDSVVVATVSLMPSDTTYLTNSTCDVGSVGTFTTNLTNVSGCD
ncbi:MAG: hypothetical protein AAFR05_17525, partial [Bacteroidota bacterium]